MSRRALLTAVPAALVAASIGAAVVGSPVGTADAARPFTVTKSQFAKVKTTSAVALKRSNANSRQIARLRQGPSRAPASPARRVPRVRRARRVRPAASTRRR